MMPLLHTCSFEKQFTDFFSIQSYPYIESKQYTRLKLINDTYSE